MNYKEAMENCIFRYKAGSHAYGTNTPESDDDFRGVFIAPIESAFDVFHTSFIGQGTIYQNLKSALANIDRGEHVAAKERIRQSLDVDQGDLNFNVETVSKPGEDEYLHELRKFVKLASNNNPNIIEFLYIENGITNITKEWEMLLEIRDAFLCKKSKNTFGAYALAQLRRIEAHRRYLFNPIKHKPTRNDFGLPECSSVPRENHNAILSIPIEYIDNNIREYVINEKRYKTALDEWNSYKKWETERNPKRKNIELKYGFDTKHAMHLVRLARMSYEIISKKKVLVYRFDREELIDIINGKWSYEKILEHVSDLQNRTENAYKESDLQEKPNYKLITNVYKNIIQKKYGIILN